MQKNTMPSLHNATETNTFTSTVTRKTYEINHKYDINGK